MHTKKIVITGGPGTGKSAVIRQLESQGCFCLHEVSREVTLEAQKEGIAQLFLEKPLLFSEKLLEARIKQHEYAEESGKDRVFLDRGLPDVPAYMDYFNSSYPEIFIHACERYRYDTIFLLPPWEEIYTTDNERYETFTQAQLIHDHLVKKYVSFGYKPIEVPRNTIESRSRFILDHLDA